MPALPGSSTVIVHAIIDGKHSAMVYPEVDIETLVDTTDYAPFPNPTYGRTKYTITGHAGAHWVEGGDIEEVGAKIIAFQSEKAARLRKERDEARRERDKIEGELDYLRRRIRTLLDQSEGINEVEYDEEE